MAVFVAAGDEAERGDQTGPFLFGGWVAPHRDWTDWFAPAWEERVLNRNPVLPYFHMTELRSAVGREKFGLSEWQAESRIDEAVDVVSSMGSLYLVLNDVNGDRFRDLFGNTQVVRPPSEQPGAYPFEPDYVGFIGFAYAVLEYVVREHPDAEHVDFVIEKKSKVTHRMENFHESLSRALDAMGHRDWVRLIGEFIPGDKKRVPLQATDLALWHIRKHRANEADRTDRERLRRMMESRVHSETGMDGDDLDRFKARADAKPALSPFKQKKPRPSADASGAGA